MPPTMKLRTRRREKLQEGVDDVSAGLAGESRGFRNAQRRPRPRKHRPNSVTLRHRLHQVQTPARSRRSLSSVTRIQSRLRPSCLFKVRVVWQRHFNHSPLGHVRAGSMLTENALAVPRPVPHV